MKARPEHKLKTQAQVLLQYMDLYGIARFYSKENG